MRRIICSLIIIASFPLLAKAQGDGGNMSLQDAIDYALRHQVKMKNAQLDELAADARNQEIIGMALPQLRGGLGINYAPLVAAFEVPNFIKFGVAGIVKDDAIDPAKFAAQSDVLPLAFQPKWTTNPQLELNQILFDPGITIALQARKKLAEIARRNVQFTREQTIVAVTKAYYNSVIVDKRLAVLRDNLKATEKLGREIEEIYKQGLQEKLDVDKITVIVNNLKSAEIKLLQYSQLANMMLKFQIGMPIDQQVVLTDNNMTDEVPGKDLMAEAFDYTKRTEYQLLETQHDLLSYDVKRYRMAALPSLNLFANYGYTLYNSEKLFAPEDKWQNSALIGVKLSVPIFDGFQRRNKVKQAKFALQKNENDMENARLGLTLAKENASITLKSSLQTLQLEHSNMDLAQEVYNKTQIKYREGVGNSLEVIQSEQQLRSAQDSYFSALLDAMNAGIDLRQSLGLIK